MTSLDSPVTNRDLAEALKAVTSGINKVINEMKAGFERMDNNFEKVHDDIQDLKVELVGRASKTEFNKLKSKVDKYLVS